MISGILSFFQYFYYTAPIIFWNVFFQFTPSIWKLFFCYHIKGIPQICWLTALKQSHARTLSHNFLHNSKTVQSKAPIYMRIHLAIVFRGRHDSSELAS